MPAPSQRSGTTMPSAEPAERLQRFAWKCMLAVPLRRMGRELVARKGSQRVAQELLFFVEQHRIRSGLLFPCKTQGKTPEHAGKRSLRPASPARSRGEETPHVCGREHEQRIAGDRERKLSCRQNEALRQHAAVRG